MVLLGDDVLLGPAVEDRGLAGEPVGRLLGAVRERVVEHREHPHPRGAGRVEGAALDERLERALTTCGSARSVNSQSDANAPPPSPARTIASAAASPTFLTAFRPKRILPSTTAKSCRDAFTSGGSTSIPISRQALT